MQEELRLRIFTSFGPPQKPNETFYDFLRRSSETKERGWALKEFISQIKDIENNLQNRLKSIIVMQWALLSGIDGLVDPLGLLEHAWDKTKLTIKKYKRDFIDNQWTASTITSKVKTKRKSATLNVLDKETSDEDPSEFGENSNTPHPTKNCLVGPIRQKRQKKDRKSLDVCSELIGNRPVILSPLLLDPTTQDQSHSNPQNSPRAFLPVSNQPLHSPAGASDNMQKMGQLEVINYPEKPKDTKKNCIVFDPDDPDLWVDINKLIHDTHKVDLKLDDDEEISCVSSNSSMIYVSDSSTASTTSLCSSENNSTDGGRLLSDRTSSEIMARKPFALRVKKKSTKAERKMRRTRRTETCVKWRTILQGDLSGNDVKITQTAASKVLKTFKKRLEYANAERISPVDCDSLEEANLYIRKTSHQLGAFLDILTFSPTEKNLSTRFEEIFEQQILQKKRRVTALVEKTITSNKKEMALQLPVTHVVHLRTHVNKWIEGHNNYKKILDAVQTGKKYTGSALGKRILAGAIAMEPQVSMRGLELIIGASLASVFADSGVKIEPEKLALKVPSANTLKAMMLNLASEVMVKLQETLHGVTRVYLCCDKGHRKGIDNFIKILSYWCEEKKEVSYFLLDLDGSGPSSKDCAEAISHSLKKLEGAVIQLSGQTTDSGGGGTLESLHNELKNLNVAKPDYLVANCTLHAQQIFMAEPAEKVFGTGGIGKRNVIQAVHSAYNLHKCYEFGVFQKLYSKAKKEANEEEDDDVRKMQEPVTTRWWCMGLALSDFKKNWDAFFSFSEGVINDSTTDTAANKIASALYSLMKEQVIKSDLAFFVAYHDYFMTPHFRFLQKAGDRSKRPGYQTNNILVRYFLMHCDLDKLKDNGWENQKIFEDFTKSLELLSEVEKTSQIKKANDFLRLAANKLSTYIKRWANELFMACLGSEKETAQRAALFLVGDDGANSNENSETRLRCFTSEVHEQDIELDPFSSFLSQFCSSKDQIKQSQGFQENLNAIKMMACGADLWTAEELSDFRKFYCETFLPLASNTQHVENFVKEASLVSETGLTEKMRSVLAILRSTIARPVAREYKENAKNRSLSANQHCKGGIKGERELISSNKTDEEIRSNPSGAPRTKDFLDFMEKFDNDCERQNKADTEYKKKCSRVKDLLFSDKCQFSEKRQAKKIEEYIKNQEKPKIPNKAQLERGVDHTALTLGRIQFGILRKKHIDHLKIELSARGLPFQAGLNFMGLKKLLMKHEEERLGSDAPDLLKSSFEPMAQWTIND